MSMGGLTADELASLRKELRDAGEKYDEHLDEIDRLRSQLASAVEGLEWYQAKAEGCRKVTSEGNEARSALDRDGGKLAAAILAEIKTEKISDT